VNKTATLFLALCVIVSTLSGCVTSRSAAKNSDYSLTHTGSEETIIREKQTEYMDKYAACIEQHRGRSEPCKGYAELVDHYTSVTAGSRVAGTGMDPHTEAILFESAAIGRWEDWGQNIAINRNTRDIVENKGAIGILEGEVNDIWKSLDRIELEYMGWDEKYDETHVADIERLTDDLDEISDFINEVDDGATEESMKLLDRIQRLERELQTLKGSK